MMACHSKATEAPASNRRDKRRNRLTARTIRGAVSKPGGAGMRTEAAESAKRGERERG